MCENKECGKLTSPFRKGLEVCTTVVLSLLPSVISGNMGNRPGGSERRSPGLLSLFFSSPLF